MSPEPFDSHAKALPAKRSKKGYGDENAHWSDKLVPDPYWEIMYGVQSLICSLLL